MRTRIYIDGFNFYFGCVKGTSHKWLDMNKLFRLILPKNQIDKIKYFTAQVSARPGSPQSPINQQTYLRALRTLPDFEIYLGHFLTHNVRMRLANPVPGKPATVEVIKTEEKGSDVNLATHLLHDAHLGLYDVAIVVSGDSDLLGPIKIVMEELGKKVGILNPQKRSSHVLNKQATFYRTIRQGAVGKSQFPSTMTDSNGTFTKPAGW